MLGILRKRQRYILWVILIIIVFTFVGLWGVPKLGSGAFSHLPNEGKNIAGSVGGKEVSEAELEYAVRGARISLRLMGYPPDLINEQSDELRMEGWRSLILVREADKAGITVSPDEIVAVIRNVLFRGQEASPDAYRAQVTALAGPMPLREFEDHVGTLLKVQKMQQLLGSTAFVTRPELEEAYAIDHTLMRFAYVPFYYTNFMASQAISTNEIEEFYNTNREEFKVPPKVSFLYALSKINPAEAAVSDDEMKTYYEENQELFVATNKAAAEAGNSASETDVLPYDAVKAQIRTNLIEQRAMEIARDRAEQVYFALVGDSQRDTAKRIAEFESAAKAKGLPAVASGLVSYEDAVPGLSNATGIIRAAFTMERSDAGDVLDVPGIGYVTFLVTDKQDAYIPELAEIEMDVRTEMQRRRALATAQEMAELLKQRLGGGVTNVVAALKAQGYTPAVTTPLDRSSSIEEIDCPAGIVARLFAFPLNALAVAPFRDGFMLVSPIEIIPADPELMYVAEEKLREQLLSREQNLLLSSWLSQAARDFRPAQRLQPGAEAAPVPE